MTLLEYLDHNPTVALAVLTFIPTTITAMGIFFNVLLTYGNRRQGREGREVIDAKIEAVRHDIKNGMGTAIAVAAVEKIKPVLDEHREAVVKDVTETAKAVAAELAEATGKWNGDERRNGPQDRRGQ